MLRLGRYEWIVVSGWEYVEASGVKYGNDM